MKARTTGVEHSQSVQMGVRSLRFFLLILSTVVLMSTGLAGCSAYTNANTQSTAPKTLSASPTSINFGNVPVGSNAAQSVTLNNSGTAIVTVSQTTISGAGFTVTNGTPLYSIAAGQSATLKIQFAPSSSGGSSGTLTVTSDADNSPTAVTLTGTGVAPTSQLSVSPSSVNFGNVVVGVSSGLGITVTNTGNSNVTISGVTTSGAGFSASGVGANTTLTPSQSATLSVSFAPAATGSVSGSVSVASDATNSPAIVSVSGAGVSSTSALPTCGKLNDTNVYLPPNYDTFTPPALGQSYTDPIFGCKITRITDATAMGQTSLGHFYNTVTPVNSNDSYLYLFNNSTGGYPIIADMSGNTVVPSSNMPGSNSAIMVWDTTNPNVFYYTSGNQFIKGTITGTSPNATVTPTVLATLPYTSVIPADEDISDDGLHIWLADCFQDCTGNVFLVTLNAGNGAATSASLGTVMSNINHHKLQIVPNNGVSVEGSSARTIYNTSGSVYSVPGNGNGNHTDWGLDGSGKMVAGAVWFDGTSQNGCPSNWGFGLLDLGSNTVGRCLTDSIDTNTVGSASHVSARDMRSQHWIVFSADDSSSSCPSSSFYCYNNPTSLSGWTAFSGEIVIWDGLGNTVRLAHHRSRTDENYWAQSRASVSRSGKYIVFDSNFNQSSKGANYTDVFVIGPLY